MFYWWGVIVLAGLAMHEDTAALWKEDPLLLVCAVGLVVAFCFMLYGIVMTALEMADRGEDLFFR